MSYAEKITVTGPFLKALNTQPGAAPALAALTPAVEPHQQFTAMPPPMMDPSFQMPAAAPLMMESVPSYPEPSLHRTANRGGGAGGMQNVGNSIGDIPSVRLHAPPGGTSQVMFG